MNVKRNRFDNRCMTSRNERKPHLALIEGLYNGAHEVTVDIPVTYQDGRRSQFTAQVFIRDVAAVDQTARAGISNGRQR